MNTTHPLILALVALLGAIACAPERALSEEPSPAPETAPGSVSCVVTACMAGAMTREDGANPWFNALCEQLPDALESCAEDGRCYTMFNAFDVDGAVDALLKAQDTDDDGALSPEEPACAINLVGYSWGGVNSLEVARRIASDARFSEHHRGIERVLIIDAYAPTAGGRLEVPENIRRFRSWRQSVPPPRDCSRRAPLGPYRGLPMVCDDPERCAEFDFSLAPQTDFPGGYTGAEIGHCRVVRAAAPYILSELGVGSPPAQGAPAVP